MKYRKRIKVILVILAFVILATGITATTLVLIAAEPPVETIDQCRELLSEARKAESEIYARDLQAEADDAWREAMLEWKRQNTRWFISRDYSALLEQLRIVREKADNAYQQSIRVKDSMHHDLAIGLAEVKRRLQLYSDSFGFLPVNRQSRRDYQTAELMYLEAKDAYEKGHYQRVGPRLEKSLSLIAGSIRESEQNLEAYFASVPVWKQWANETIEWSRMHKKPVIIVEKFARQCYIYKNGYKVQTFDAEFGINWVGDKRHKGDKATPEGKYRITSKKTGRHTRFHKALLINYPNDDDKRRFAREVHQGTISGSTAIGGLIEIHGGGGKRINWTDGCVALSNDDMDKLFRQVQVGTPVTIIGSLKNLNELKGYRQQATPSM